MMDDDLYRELTKGIEIITRRSSWLLDEKLSRHAFDDARIIHEEAELLQEIIDRVQAAVKEVMKGEWQK